MKEIQKEIDVCRLQAKSLCQDLLKKNGKEYSEIYNLELPELIECLKPEQKSEVAKELEKAQKYANRLPDGEEKTAVLEEIQDLLDKLK